MKQKKIKRTVFLIFIPLQFFKVCFFNIKHTVLWGYLEKDSGFITQDKTWITWKERSCLLVTWLLIVSASLQHPRKNKSTFWYSQSLFLTKSLPWFTELFTRLKAGYTQSHKEHESSDTSPCWKSLASETGVSGEGKLEQELTQIINYGFLPKAFDTYMLPTSVVHLIVHMPVYPQLTQWLSYWRALKLLTNALSLTI